MHGVEQHSGVLDRLGESIASGARAPSTVLTLAALEEEFGVSRTLVREVVRVLESMGMVESRRRVGVTVRPPRDWNPFDPRLIRWRLGGPGRDAPRLKGPEPFTREVAAHAKGRDGAAAKPIFIAGHSRGVQQAPGGVRGAGAADG